jgi:SAM-dependent methyltransferase
MSVIQLYAAMLEAQARLQYPFERFFYSHDAWKQATTVIDFGCGNGAYLDMVAREFPAKRYYGIEANPEMLALAQTQFARENVSFRTSLAEIDAPCVDFVLMRYVVMHLVDRAGVFDAVSRRLSGPGAGVLVIEPDDKRVLVRPLFPLLDEALALIKEASYDRDLTPRLDAEFSRAGLSKIDEVSCVISDRIELTEQKLLRYVLGILEIGFQARLSAAQKAQLLDWYLDDDRYAQFGFYGRMYAPGSAVPNG